MIVFLKLNDLAYASSPFYEHGYVRDLVENQIVRCGPAGAIWRVVNIEHGAQMKIGLEPYDPHEVPLWANVVELPMPTNRSAQPYVASHAA